MGLQRSSLDYYLSSWTDEESLSKELQRIITLNDFARDRGSILIMVIFTDPNQLIFDYGFEEYQRPLLEFADKRRIPTIDLVQAYRPVYAQEGFGSLFIYNDGHPNENGYKVIAEYIANFIIENGFIK
jgi:hypothetical protein